MLHKKIQAFRAILGTFLALTMLITFLPALPQMVSAEDAISPIDVTDDYGLVNVSISWTSMSFEYIPPIWDPDTLTYGESGWQPKETNGGQITVKNEENDDDLNIKAEVKYEPAISEVTGTLSDGNGTSVTEGFLLASGGSKALSLSLSGIPSETPENGGDGSLVLGSIKVTLTTSVVYYLNQITADGSITIDGELHTVLYGSTSYNVPITVTNDAVVTLKNSVGLRTTTENVITVGENANLKLRVNGTGHSLTSTRAGGIVLGNGSSLEVVGTGSAVAESKLTVKAGCLYYYPYYEPGTTTPFKWGNIATVGIGAGVGKVAGDISFQNLTLDVTGGNVWYAEVVDQNVWDRLYGSAAIGTSMAYGLTSACGNITFTDTAVTALAPGEQAAVIGMGAVVNKGSSTIGDITFNGNTQLNLTMSPSKIEHYGAMIGFCQMTDYSTLSLGKITFHNVTSTNGLDTLLEECTFPDDFDKFGRYKVGMGWYDNYVPTNTPFGGVYVGSTVVSDGAGYAKTSA